MPRPVRRFLARLGIAASLAVAAGGCAEGAGIQRGGAINGETLTVYSTLPRPQEGASRDIADGEKLALAEAGGRAGAYKVNFALLDEAAEAGSGADAAPAEAGSDARAATDAAAAAARQALADAQTVAVIGALESETARTAVPLLNAAGILLVSPGAGDPGLTCPANPGDPERYQPAGVPTFARIVGDDRALAQALVAAAELRRGEGLAVEAESDPDARRLAGAVRAAARSRGLRVAGDARRADAVVYAGDDARAAAGIAAALAEEAPRARILFGDPLVRAGVAARLGTAAVSRVRLVSRAPGLVASPALRDFAGRFARRYGRRPGPYAALGHAAMASVLDAIARAGVEARQRRLVVDARLGGPPTPTLLGPLRLEASGARADAAFYASAPGRPETERIAVPGSGCGTGER